MDPIKASLLKKSRAAKTESRGKLISLLCISLIVFIVLAIFYFVASKGLATFFKDKVSLWRFLTQSDWNPSLKDSHGRPEVGALPMIMGSFGVTFLAALLATPFAIGAGIFMTEISPKRGKRFYNPLWNYWLGFHLLFMVLSGYQ